MLDIGFWELAVIAAIMLIVLGPERLPGVARTAGFWLSKVRRMINDVKADVKREMDAAELGDLDDVKNQINQAGQSFQRSGKVLNEELMKTVGNSDESDNPNPKDNADEHGKNIQ